MEDIDNIRKIASDVATRMGLEIFDVKLSRHGRRSSLTVIIDNDKDYVGIDECEAFSKEFGPVLDAEELMGNYVLEVSSPGLDRPLRKIEDFERFNGRLAKIKMLDDEGKNLVVVGRINGCEVPEGKFLLDVDGTMKSYDFSKVLSANLEVEF